VIKPDGIPFTLEDNFEYRIKIEYENFGIADEEGAKKVLAKEILSSLVVFETIRSKIKDFDLGSFKRDLMGYFDFYQTIAEVCIRHSKSSVRHSIPFVRQKYWHFSNFICTFHGGNVFMGYYQAKQFIQ